MSVYPDNIPELGTEPEQWEPKSPEEWFRKDPFREFDVPIEIKLPEQGQLSVFNSWRHYPISLRRQVWREREIAANLYALARDWETIPGIRSIGVSKQHDGSARRLVGVISVESETPEDFDLTHEYYNIPRSMEVRSRISDLDSIENARSVPLKIEYSLPPSRLSLGIVQPGQFFTASGKLPMPIATPTLQAGDIVAGEDPAGFRNPGTLAAIISKENDDTPLLLSAAHVFGKPGWKVVADVPTPTEVGRVINADQDLDAAIAELKEPWIVDYRLRSVGVVPAAPYMPTADIPVQMVGGSSGHQKGWINLVNSIPVGGKSVGVIPHFAASISSHRGDSGALLITSHGKNIPIPLAFANKMYPQAIDAMTCAMLGILVAGPSHAISSSTRPQTYFTPILDILDFFKMQAWVRSI